MRRALIFSVAAGFCASAVASSRPLPVETRVVPTGKAPCGIAARAGSIWLGVYEAGNLLGMNGEHGSVETRVRVGRFACRVAVGRAAVWVTRDQAGEVVRVSRGTGRVSRTRVGRGAFDVVLARGSVWTTSYETGAIARIDAATGRVSRVFRDGPNPAGITACAGRLWVGHGRSATWLTAIDPTTNAVERIDVRTITPGWPRCVRGDLWVTAPETVLKVDGASGRVLGRLRVGATPAEAALGPDGLVWVTDKELSTIFRLDPVRLTVVDSFPAGPGAFSLVRIADRMWVTSFAGSDVRSYSP